MPITKSSNLLRSMHSHLLNFEEFFNPEEPGQNSILADVDVVVVPDEVLRYRDIQLRDGIKQFNFRTPLDKD